MLSAAGSLGRGLRVSLHRCHICMAREFVLNPASKEHFRKYTVEIKRLLSRIVQKSSQEWKRTEFEEITL